MTSGFLSPGRPRRQFPADVDFIPQSILRKDIQQVARILDAQIEENWDDLDKFEGVTFLSASTKIPVSIRHYAGHPEGTVTVYLPFEMSGIDAISKTIASVVEELRFSTDDTYWQRKDDPEL